MSRAPYWTPDRIADVEFLLDAGTPAGAIAHRLGRKPGSIARNLRRQARPDLAAPFEREAWQAAGPSRHEAHKAAKRARLQARRAA